jgi:tetratricopeptide (TPR) repeat protein
MPDPLHLADTRNEADGVDGPPEKSSWRWAAPPTPGPGLPPPISHFAGHQAPPPQPTSVKIGDATRSFIRAYQKVPLISAPGDLIRAKNGLAALTAQIQAEPGNPATYLWLADAVDRAQKDGLALAAIRSLVDPTAIAEFLAIRTAGRLGIDETPQTILRKSAFGLANRRLRSNPDHSPSLYFLSRVYLAQKQPQQALRFAWRAMARDPAEALPTVVAGLALLQLGRVQQASTLGWHVVDRGSTLGLIPLARMTRDGHPDHRVLAVAAQHGMHVPPSGPTTRLRMIEVAQFVRRHVATHEAARYHGPSPDASQVIGEAVQSQKKKLERILQS